MDMTSIALIDLPSDYQRTGNIEKTNTSLSYTVTMVRVYDSPSTTFITWLHVSSQVA